MSGRVLVLAYHNIVPDGTLPLGDRPNHLPLSRFVGQLAALRETHDVIPLAETLEPSSDRRRRPRAVITFDDAYRGAVIHGIPEVVRHGLPATIFVAPGCLGGKSFWWDALARDAAGLDASVRDRALGELRGEDAAIRAWAARAGAPAADVADVACAAADAEVIRAASLPGITLGSHTWSHPNLTRLSPDELASELTRPLEWLHQRVANPQRWIAYPYGLHNATVERAAAAAGYEAALAIRGGWLPPVPTNRFALPRVNIPPGLTAHGFALRAAGLLSG